MMKAVANSGADRNEINIARSGAHAMGRLLELVAESLIKYGAQALRRSPRGVRIMSRHLMQGIRRNGDVGDALDRIVSGRKLKRQLAELDSELSANTPKRVARSRRRRRRS